MVICFVFFPRVGGIVVFTFRGYETNMREACAKSLLSYCGGAWNASLNAFLLEVSPSNKAVEICRVCFSKEINRAQCFDKNPTGLIKRSEEDYISCIVSFLFYLIILLLKEVEK